VIALDHTSKASPEKFAQLLESSDISEEQLSNWVEEFETSLKVNSQSSAFLVRALIEELDRETSISSNNLSKIVDQAKTDRNHQSDSNANLSNPHEPVIDHREFYDLVYEAAEKSRIDLEKEMNPVSSDCFGLRLGRIFQLLS
jgi:hypothetical protein